MTDAPKLKHWGQQWKQPIRPEAPCRERTNTCGMMGECYRCDADNGEICKDNVS